MVPIPDRLEKGKDGEKHGMLQGISQRSLPVLSSASEGWGDLSTAASWARAQSVTDEDRQGS